MEKYYAFSLIMSKKIIDLDVETWQDKRRMRLLELII